MHQKVIEISQALKALADPDGAGEKLMPDGSTMQVFGVKMRDVFDIAKTNTSLELALVQELIDSDSYEMRMVGVSILDFKARKTKLDDSGRRQLYDMYMGNLENLGLWDFVDRAAPRVVGWYLLDKPRAPMFELAASSKPIERRTAITAAFWWIRQHDLEDAFRLIDALLEDESELVTRPVGTALREIGKIDEVRLRRYLDQNGHRMKIHTLRMAQTRLENN